MRKFLLLPFLAAVLPAPQVVASERPGQAVTIRVPHGDLDLASPDDVKVLKRRIVAAVDRACRVRTSQVGGLAVSDPKCRTDALQAALAAMERRRVVQVAAAD